ncbi:cytochrome b [Sphingomonas oligophenolica]|uniref:Cytochrome b n=1 Tax=Sphingomonas oligophenolica TaxID=301154 RepID=A0A502CR39_9SPHN|nr:cytochrome b [Sphingomonas oligophenolica]TPG15293.1 cytochrome b [Sphingomonas oligophenolica]
MPVSDTARVRYSTVAIWLHWSIAALVIANLAIGLLHDSLLHGVRWAIPLHMSFGLTVLILSLARVAWRLSHPFLPAPTDVPRWQQVAARATHIALYALILLMPFTGWMMASAGKHPIGFYWLVDAPKLPVSKALGDVAHQGHGVLGWLMLALVALHVGAALRHHFLLRDGVLGRMIPAVANDRG